MPTKPEGRRLEKLEKGATEATAGVYSQPAFFQRPAGLSSIVPGLAQSTTFLTPKTANPFAGSFQQQRAPGAQYTNYERMAPNVGGPLTAPQVPEGYVPPGTQPETIRVYPDGSPVPEDTDVFDPSDIEKNKNKFLIDINQTRAEQGLPPFETFEEYIADSIGDFGTGYIGMAEGGIASLEPMYMAEGGFSSFMANLGGNLTDFGAAIGGGGSGSGETGRASAKPSASADMSGGQSVQSLMERIKELEKQLAEKDQEGLRTLFSSFSNKDPMKNSAPVDKSKLTMGAYAGGGDVDFPRMNGPISGPGTETSDDIPAMLSDGEFVVNAKAVRGIGSLEGAGKSKEEQRREGARMMYALQLAGEKAMRKA